MQFKRSTADATDTQARSKAERKTKRESPSTLKCDVNPAICLKIAMSISCDLFKDSNDVEIDQSSFVIVFILVLLRKKCIHRFKYISYMRGEGRRGRSQIFGCARVQPNPPQQDNHLYHFDLRPKPKQNRHTK